MGGFALTDKCIVSRWTLLVPLLVGFLTLFSRRGALWSIVSGLSVGSTVPSIALGGVRVFLLSFDPSGIYFVLL